MTTSTSSRTESIDEILSRTMTPATVRTAALPAAHPAEADVFARHEGIPGHDQAALTQARILSIGGGGLGGWTSLALLRSGATHVTIVDPDLVDRTNLARQFFFPNDLGQPKATSLVSNLAAHAVAGEATITGLPFTFAEAERDFPLAADLVMVGVDNNECRLQTVRWARLRRIPAIFTMLSRDGMRCHCFLQGPASTDPCLWCALPNLDPEVAIPCASAVVTSCLMAAALSVFFAHRALMGWPDGAYFNWRELDLLGFAEDRTGVIGARAGCNVCGSFRS
jgi:molybdopterin/thiamine biosynthesis adenylyltransferase